MKFFLTITLLLLSFNLYAASPFNYFKNRDTKIFPIPVFESRPDEGLTFGLMPVMVVSDKEDEAIKAILAVIGQYNSVTKIGGGGLAYLYPTPDQEIELFFEMSQRYAREASLRYFNPTLKNKIYLEGDLVYLKSPFGRFYGIGSQRIESNMSNYTSRNFNLDLTGGYLFFKNIRVNWTTRWHTTDLLNRAIEEIDDTLTRYGGLPEVVDSTNWINELSVTFDNRPEREYSKKGSQASIAYFISNKKLGSDKNFQGWKLEALQLVPFIKNRLTTVFRFQFQEIFGERVPFYELSSLGGENEFRAFTPGRFVDQGKVLFQIENRFRLFDATLFQKSFSIYTDPFFELGRVFSSLSTIGFSDWQPVGGLGLRLFVPPNIIGRLDAAIGSDGFEIYTQLGYPF